MTDNTMREEFEKWADRQHWLSDNLCRATARYSTGAPDYKEDGAYVGKGVGIAWQAWQAAHQARDAWCTCGAVSGGLTKCTKDATNKE